MNAIDGSPVYLDYAATTPVDPRVAAAMAECLTIDGTFGNSASNTHAYGRAAAARVAAAREQVAALINARPEEIVFTSGATESDNLALLGVVRAQADRGRHIVTVRTEHKAVVDTAKRLEKEGIQVSWLETDRAGRLDPDSVRAALRPDTVLVSVMHANNETGVLQDIAAIGAICRGRDVLFHSDAAQSAGKIPVDVAQLNVDLLAFTAHKLYGPKGVGALYVAPRARPRLTPLLFGGGQERGLRSGTLATHQIVGFGAAAELARLQAPAEAERLREWRDELWSVLEALGGVHRNGHSVHVLPGLLNVSFERIEGESLVTGLVELAVSSGSACNSASAEPSYVLRALGRSTQLAQSALRISLGRFTTAAQPRLAAEVIGREVSRLRSICP